MIALILSAAFCNAEVCPGHGDNLVVERECVRIFKKGLK